MNFKNPKQRTKEVSISLEYTNAVDLKRVLAVLNDLIGSGVQMYSGDIKSTLKTGKESRFNFVQFYPDAIHESKESEINRKFICVSYCFTSS